MKNEKGHGTNKLPYLTYRIYGSILSKHDKCEYCNKQATLVHHRDFDRNNNGYSNMAYSCDQCHNTGHSKYDPTKTIRKHLDYGNKHVNFKQNVTFKDIVLAKHMGLTQIEAAWFLNCDFKTINRRCKKMNITWRNI